MDNRALNFFDSQIKGKVDEIYDYQPEISPTGDFVRLQGINVIINQIRNLLLTPLGFYPFDPTYGSLLYKQLFEPADKITENKIMYECKERVLQYVPKINIDKVEVFYFNTGKGFKVDMHIDRKGVKGKVSLTLPVQETLFGLEDIIYESTRTI